MSPPKQPKVILFDIGGVCVVSPFQSILDYELSLGIPPGWINYSISKSGPNGFWHRLETGSLPLNDDFYAGFSKDLHDANRWKIFYQKQKTLNPQLSENLPPVPSLDAKWLFHEMMSRSQAPDPCMYPALQSLKASGKFILAALSNTIIFPSGHPLHRKDILDDPVRSLFEVFVSSAHVGLRKPDPQIYRLTLEKINQFARSNMGTERGKAARWADGIQADEVLFLDDIGQNLKGAKQIGFQTIKVSLGKTYQAVEQLEEITQLSLAGDHPKITSKPKMRTPKAKI